MRATILASIALAVSLAASGCSDAPPSDIVDKITASLKQQGVNVSSISDFDSEMLPIPPDKPHQQDYEVHFGIHLADGKVVRGLAHYGRYSMGDTWRLRGDPAVEE